MITRMCDEYFQIQYYQAKLRKQKDYGDNVGQIIRMRRVYESLYSSYYQKNMLTGIADREFLDKCYMSRLIKNGIGQSLSDCTRIIRIDRAEVLILGTNMPIEEISKEV